MEQSKSLGKKKSLIAQVLRIFSLPVVLADE